MIKYLGVDWGLSRIGLSLADSESRMAMPLFTVNSLSALMDVIKKEKIDVLVIGDPKKLNGDSSDNPDFLRFLNYLNKHQQEYKFNYSLIDERLSSIEADAIMNKKMNSNRDVLASMIILQSYLDSNI